MPSIYHALNEYIGYTLHLETVPSTDRIKAAPPWRKYEYPKQVALSESELQAAWEKVLDTPVEGPLEEIPLGRLEDLPSHDAFMGGLDEQALDELSRQIVRSLR